MSLAAKDFEKIEQIVDRVVERSVAKATAHLASKKDLERLATKDDLNRLDLRLTTAIGLLQRDSFGRLEDHELRIARLESGR